MAKWTALSSSWMNWSTAESSWKKSSAAWRTVGWVASLLGLAGSGHARVKCQEVFIELPGKSCFELAKKHSILAAWLLVPQSYHPISL